MPGGWIHLGFYPSTKFCQARPSNSKRINKKILKIDRLFFLCALNIAVKRLISSCTPPFRVVINIFDRLKAWKDNQNILGFKVIRETLEVFLTAHDYIHFKIMYKVVYISALLKWILCVFVNLTCCCLHTKLLCCIDKLCCLQKPCIDKVYSPLSPVVCLLKSRRYQGLLNLVGWWRSLGPASSEAEHVCRHALMCTYIKYIYADTQSWLVEPTQTENIALKHKQHR